MSIKFCKTILPLLLIMFVVGCNSKISKSVLDVKVLSVDKNILRGKMIGQFLGSSSGYIANDVIIVGVQITINQEILLEDLKFTHSQLAYYSEVESIPMDVTIVTDGRSNCLILRLHGKRMKRIRISPELAEFLHEKEGN